MKLTNQLAFIVGLLGVTAAVADPQEHGALYHAFMSQANIHLHTYWQSTQRQ
jgi:hypothetical protein